MIWPTANTYPGGTIPDDAKFGSQGGKHTGVNIGSLGNPVVAAAAGTVQYKGDMKSKGWSIHIVHSDGYETRYQHLDPGSLTVNKGDTVVDGQQIAKVGYSGLEYTYGASAIYAAHLHFEILKSSVFIDPEKYLGSGEVIYVRGSRLSNSVPPAAPSPSSGAVWPLVVGALIVPERSDKWPRSSRAIGARRANGAKGHCGVDLYAKEGDPILAVDDGTIVNFYWFYRGTYALVVAHSGYVVVYGEVKRESMDLGWDSPTIRIGERGLTKDTGKSGTAVKAGQQIAIVGKMFRSSMLHFEMYESGTTANKKWTDFPGDPPAGLYDPTQFLLTLRDRKKSSKTTAKEQLRSTSECR